MTPQFMADFANLPSSCNVFPQITGPQLPWDPDPVWDAVNRFFVPPLALGECNLTGCDADSCWMLESAKSGLSCAEGTHVFKT